MMTLDLPPLPLALPPMTAEWDVDAYLGYLSTWSARVAALSATGRDPLAAYAPALRAAWGDGVRVVTWPLTVTAGTVP